ncbi:hypothetical protein H6A30_11365 [Bacteroides caecigallinarum]|uniref:hypothetical protein n=1 Tax=Bacteroides caecigallinarum TaxID=1411144 RepID=UPI00195C0009|nr:hypothetical protein [Bacteroides caecigallinarum]MBM6890843.1 hypothetical protein [Bacteroides caecigallinarum]
MFLALASAVREENALMSYGFSFPKACGGIGDLSLHFSFCQPCMKFRAVVPARLPIGTQAYRQGWCCRSHSGLDEG